MDPSVGLTASDVDERVARHGYNRLDEVTPRPAWLQYLDQFRNGLVAVLLVGAVLAAAIGDVKDSIAIAVVLTFNATVGYVQEHRAAASLASLKGLVPLRVRARRDGQVVELDVEDLVPGDIVLLEAGHRVPADGRVIGAWAAAVDESSLTGESEPAAKSAEDDVPPDAALGDRSTAVFMQTQLARGRLECLVTATGMATEIGRLAGSLAGVADHKTPLQRQLDHLSARLVLLSGAVVAAYIALGLLRSQPLADLTISSVALIVAAVPEGLPAVVTLTLALGAHRLAQRGAIVKRLASVETLGSTSVICSDKTGTLTLNQMTARALVVEGHVLEVTGEGYEVDGSVVGADAVAPSSLGRFAEAAVLCNDTHVRDGAVIGDPTEGALVVLASKLAPGVGDVRERSARVAEVPFDSARKFMATIHADPDEPGCSLLIAKGAWDVIVPRCASTAAAGGGDRPLEKACAEGLASQARELAGTGLRVLAVASRRLDRPAEAVALLDDTAREDLVHDLTLLGLVGLVDPPRQEVIGSIARCRGAGVAVKMVTGDHLDTARAIAARLGIEGEAIEGRELDAISDADLPERLSRVGVLARVSPQHKVRVVVALSRGGDIVAMTGDGVNDAPALSAADIGVVMGGTGTDVARESADLVLVDDNFATITRAVEEGRAIYGNIVKFVRFQVATNIGALVTFVGAQVVGLPVPFTPIQILWVNLIMDGPPAMALGVDPVMASTMDQPPRDPDAQILSRQRLVPVLAIGALMAAGTLGVLAFWRARGDAGVASTAAFSTFVLFQVANAFNVRDEDGTIFTRSSLTNARLWGALASVLVLQVAAVHVPLGQEVFGTTGLAPAHWLLAAAVASTVIWVDEARKWSDRRRSVVPREGDRWDDRPYPIARAGVTVGIRATGDSEERCHER